MSMQSKKQSVAIFSYPVLHEGLLELTCGFVGTGEALYARAVNSSWKAYYDKLATASQQFHSKKHVHLSICTSYQAVFASASRVRLAQHSDLQLHEENELLQECAGKYADIDTLLVAQELGLLLSPALMRGAAASKCLSKLEWLHTEQHCPLPDDIAAAAARAGDVTMLRWLQESGCGLSEETSKAAAQTVQNLHVLEFLYEKSCPWHKYVCGDADEAGDLEQLKWLHAHGALVDYSTAATAAKGGAVHVFEWLQQQQGIEFTEHTMAFAALNGHLQLCQWLRAQQCPWDCIVAHVAAAGNHFEILRWLIESGCPYTNETLCVYAVDGCTPDDLSIYFDCCIVKTQNISTHCKCKCNQI
jgi:hypothetical protein